MAADQKEKKAEAKKTPAEHIKNIRRAVGEISRLSPVFHATNKFEETKYAHELKEYTKQLETDLDALGLDAAKAKPVKDALKKLAEDTEAEYTQAVKDPNFEWSTDKWAKHFEGVLGTLASLSPVPAQNPKVDTFVKRAKENIEEFQKEKFNAELTALDRSLENQRVTNKIAQQALQVAKSLGYHPSRAGYRKLFVSTNQEPDEKDLEDDANKALIRKYTDEEAARRVKKLVESKDEIFKREGSHLLLKVGKEGCRPTYPLADRDYLAGYEEATDLMQIKHPNSPLSFYIPIVAAAARDPERAYVPEGMINETYILEKILPVLASAANKGIAMQLDPDLRNYLNQLKQDTLNDRFAITTKLFGESSLVKAIDKLLDKELDMRKTGIKQKLIGKDKKGMETRVTDLTKQLNDQKDLGLAKKYDDAKALPSAPNIGAAPANPPATNPDAKVDEATVLERIGLKGILPDDKTPEPQTPAEKITFIKQQLTTVEAVLAAAGDGVGMIRGQVGRLNNEIAAADRAATDRLQTIANRPDFLKSDAKNPGQIDKLANFQALQDQKLAEVVIRAKVLKHEIEKITAASSPVSAELKGMVQQASDCVANARALKTECSGLDATIQTYKQARAKEKAEVDAAIKQTNAASPTPGGGGGGP